MGSYHMSRFNAGWQIYRLYQSGPETDRNKLLICSVTCRDVALRVFNGLQQRQNTK